MKRGNRETQKNICFLKSGLADDGIDASSELKQVLVGAMMKFFVVLKPRVSINYSFCEHSQGYFYYFHDGIKIEFKVECGSTVLPFISYQSIRLALNSAINRRKSLSRLLGEP